MVEGAIFSSFARSVGRTGPFAATCDKSLYWATRKQLRDICTTWCRSSPRRSLRTFDSVHPLAAVVELEPIALPASMPAITPP